MSGLLLVYCVLIVVYCARAYRKSLSKFPYYLYRVGNMIIRCLRAAEHRLFDCEAELCSPEDKPEDC